MTFYNKCNRLGKQGIFAVLIKVRSKKIYGSCNSIGYTIAIIFRQFYLFSFENDQDIYNIKIDKVNNSTESISENCDHDLFSFGNNLFINFILKPNQIKDIEFSFRPLKDISSM